MAPREKGCQFRDCLSMPLRRRNINSYEGREFNPREEVEVKHPQTVDEMATSLNLVLILGMVASLKGTTAS